MLVTSTVTSFLVAMMAYWRIGDRGTTSTSSRPSIATEVVVATYRRHNYFSAHYFRKRVLQDTPHTMARRSSPAAPEKPSIQTEYRFYKYTHIIGGNTANVEEVDHVLFVVIDTESQQDPPVWDALLKDIQSVMILLMKLYTHTHTRAHALDHVRIQAIMGSR